MEQKHYIDIQNIRENDDELRTKNTSAFTTDSLIQITEKFDGSNASCRYDVVTDELISFSRKKQLSFDNTLNGFWDYIKNLPASTKAVFKEYSNYYIFGEWNCLSGDTIIRKTSAGKNNVYMTLREMYNFLNSPTPDVYHHNTNKGYLKIIQSIMAGKNKQEDITSEYINTNPNTVKKTVKIWITKTERKGYIKRQDNYYCVTEAGKIFYKDKMTGKDSWWHRNGMPSIFSLYQDEWKIKPNKIKNIYFTGNKEVYEVKTKNGFSIKATLNHKFLTPSGFKELKEIHEFDCVAITRFFNEGRMPRSYGAGTKQIIDKQKEYKKKIGKCEKCGKKTDYLELHHKDNNFMNNDISNWQALCKKCHQDIHKGNKNRAKFEYWVDFDYITSITKIGVEDCYDIEMEGEENTANFVANGFIVHNCKNKIIYNDTGKTKHWYVYDIFDAFTNTWKEQAIVKEFCKKANLEYIHELYSGKFISWEHCRSFMNNSAYGDTQEGIVVKNQTALSDWDSHNTKNPFYLKIVNEAFKESMSVKMIDPEKEKNKAKAGELMESICTKNRVEKELYKMRDEGIIPEKITPQDMGLVARNLPKRIYTDLLKEEKELVMQCGEYAGKMCNMLSMKYAKQIILGD